MDGGTLDGMWANDRLNGLCTLKAKGEAAETVIYKDDMLIQNNKTGISGGDLVYMCFSIFMMLVFYAAIPLGLFIGDGELFSLMGVYIIYLIWSCCHASTKYISHLVELDQVFANVSAAIKSPPQITFTIQNYHYETRRRTNSKGRTTTHRVRVNTHYAAIPFIFSQWVDRSPPANTLHFLTVLKLARLRTEKFF